MENVDHQIMEAATRGNEAGLEALLSLPGIKGMSKNTDGRTALMWAAKNGHTSCARLLIPVSDALAKDKRSMTASELACNEGHASLAAFIDAYAFALSEVSTLGSLVTVGATRNKGSLRV